MPVIRVDELHEQLEAHIYELEAVLAEMREMYGDRLHKMHYEDGTSITAPILCSLVNGYVALTKFPRGDDDL